MTDSDVPTQPAASNDPMSGLADELAQAEAELAGVEAALGRLDEGTKGRCVVCGSDIDGDLQGRVSGALTCAAHS